MARSRARLGLVLLVALLGACSPPTAGGGAPPTVAASTPTDGETNVWVGTPITVTFSEALDPATVDVATVLLAGDGSVDLAKTLALSDGDTRLTVTPVAPLALPEDLTLSLTAGIRDRTGNPLAATAWSWSVPSWLRFGDDPVHASTTRFGIYPPHLALDGDDRPIVATNLDAAPFAVVRRWDGAAWQTLPPLAGAGGTVRVADLTVDAGGQLLVAWSGYPAGGSNADLYVSRWDEDDEWIVLGNVPLVVDPSTFPSAAALAVDALGRVTVAWSETDLGASDLYVWRWNGTAWSALGGKLDVDDAAGVSAVDLALAPNGSPIVSWAQTFYGTTHVKLWNPTSLAWDALGGSLSAIEQVPSLLVRLDGSVVAGVVDAAGGFRLLAYTAPGWSTLAPAHLANPGWTLSGRPSLALASTGEPVAAWTETLGAATVHYVARLTEDGWAYLGAPIAGAPPRYLLHLRLAMDGDDVPTLAYVSEAPIVGTSDVELETLARRQNR